MKFIVHENPARRGASNYIARVDLAPFGFEGEMEQMWFQPLDGGLFELCCIPFRAYGLALGDLVSISHDGSSVAGVERASGRRVLRVFLLPTAETSSVAGEIKSEVSRLGLLSEWSGDRHIAIDVPKQADIGALMSIADREESGSRAFWEWGDAIPFSATTNLM